MRRLLGWLLLCSLSLVMFLTLFYYARHYWGITLLDGRLVAAQEPNRYILVAELMGLGLIVLWAAFEAGLEIKRAVKPVCSLKTGPVTAKDIEWYGVTEKGAYAKAKTGHFLHRSSGEQES